MAMMFRNSALGKGLPQMATSVMGAGSCRRCLHLALSRRSVTSLPSKPTTASNVQLAIQARCLHASSRVHAAPKSKDRGPVSEEDTQTDFAALNVLGSMPAPTTAIDMCMDDGFALNSGLRVTGAGVMLVAGECFKWRPWIREGRIEGTIGSGGVGDDKAGHLKTNAGKLKNAKGQLDVDKHAWGILDLVWPKPDLLILGTGASIVPLSPETRRNINALGIRIEVQDTRNAAAQFNLLATERGVQDVAAALVPIGWREGA